MEGTGNKNFMEYVRFMRQALFDIPEAVQQDGEIKGNLTQGILRKWMDSVHNSATAQSIHIPEDERWYKLIARLSKRNIEKVEEVERLLKKEIIHSPVRTKNLSPHFLAFLGNKNEEDGYKLLCDIANGHKTLAQVHAEHIEFENVIHIKTEDEQSDCLLSRNVVEGSFATNFGSSNFLQNPDVSQRESMQTMGYERPSMVIPSAQEEPAVISPYRSETDPSHMDVSNYHSLSSLSSMMTSNVSHSSSNKDNTSSNFSETSSNAPALPFYPKDPEMSVNNYVSPQYQAAACNPSPQQDNYFVSTGSTAISQPQQTSQWSGENVYGHNVYGSRIQSDSECHLNASSESSGTNFGELVGLLTKRLAEARESESKLWKKLTETETHLLQVSTDLLRKENENKTLKDRLQNIESMIQSQKGKQNVSKEFLENHISSMKKCIDTLTKMKADCEEIEKQEDIPNPGKDQQHTTKQSSHAFDESAVCLGTTEHEQANPYEMHASHLDRRENERKRTSTSCEGHQAGIDVNVQQNLLMDLKMFMAREFQNVHQRLSGIEGILSKQTNKPLFQSPYEPPSQSSARLNRSVSEIPKNRAPGNCLPVSSSELFTRRSSTMTTRVATDASNFTNPTSSRPVPAETSSNLPIAVNLSLERIRDLLPPTCTLNDAERIYCKVNDSKRRHLLGLKLFNYFFSMEDQKRGNPSNLSTSKLEIIKKICFARFPVSQDVVRREWKEILTKIYTRCRRLRFEEKRTKTESYQSVIYCDNEDIA